MKIMHCKQLHTIWQFVLLIIILIITIYIKSEWAWLVIITYIAFKFKLIDQDFILLLNDLRLAWDGKYKAKSRTTEDNTTINNNIIIENNVSNTDKRSFLRQYKENIDLIIKWFQYYKNINFKTNKKLNFSNEATIYPDGILETDKVDTILEVKMGRVNSSIIEDKILTFNRYQELYKQINKKIIIYFAFLIKNEEDKSRIVNLIEKRTFDLNLNVLFFIGESGNIKLLKEIKYQEQRSLTQ